MFKARVLRNALTDKIEKDTEFTLIDVLLHKDLPATVRGESDILYQRLLSNKAEWFKQILNYALFDLKPPQKYEDLNKINQINRNASNFLENCGKKFAGFFIKESKDERLIGLSDLQKLLNSTIDEFIKPNNEINQNRMYAGHFQRFFENFLRWKAFGTADSSIKLVLEKIVPFLIKNCKILAYQQLISRILCDFNGNIDADTKYTIISQVLYYSYQAVKYIRSNEEIQLPIINYTDVFNESEQPINTRKNPIPFIKYNYNSKNRIPLNGQDKLEIDWSDHLKIETNFSDVESTEFIVYLLIMSIRTSIFEQSDNINAFRDDEKTNYRLIQSLLYCGIVSDVKSLISLEAFRLLDIVFNGITSIELEKWKSHESDKLQMKFYDNYANALIYDSNEPNLKMIQALPIFWNHRYKNSNYQMSEDELKPVDVSDYYGNEIKKTRKREEGETAFEILQPCLLAEPPFSSMLIHTYVKIFIDILDERKKLYENEEKTTEILDSMLDLDGIVIDFFRHHFKFADKKKEVKMCDLFQSIIPLSPFDQFFSKEALRIIRTPLNGFIYDFFLRYYNTNDNSNTLFEVNEDVNMTTIAHIREIKEFDAYIHFALNIRDIIKLNPMPSDYIYNFSMRSNYDDDDDNNEEEEIKTKIFLNEEEEAVNENQVNKESV